MQELKLTILHAISLRLRAGIMLEYIIRSSLVAFVNFVGKLSTSFHTKVYLKNYPIIGGHEYQLKSNKPFSRY